MSRLLVVYASAILMILVQGCGNKQEHPTKVMAITNNSEIRETPQVKKIPLSKEFKSYWYNGQAEISSFELAQERYGEIRQGSAVLIYVTEDFLPEKQVKADNYSKSNTPILKLNSTKKFNTGIYPYSIMESSFYPVGQQSHALKVSASVQEWCGQAYSQINNREKFEVKSHSYFETEADQSFEIEKAPLENEIWNIIRIDPTKLPTGTFEMVPSLEFARLRHKNIKAYTANATLENGLYTLVYPELGRKLVIKYNSDFPYDIQGWEESNTIGYGAQKRILTSKATRLKSIRSAYWSKNKNADLPLRQELMLDQ
ncbi:septum formation inhibitor Maf [Winogradskyella aurantiaca]|uniref:septum formation inhibitor Maf n=1 Tax=Winogradskyella aurantiaca TaxID=2219558 RepID=UPI001E6041EB|nr:septum formation inhibitor Maf [Winogradskyella aurantiaca]